ncbi:hypothetical protein EB74_24430 [Mycobacterium sp. SWH-M5]|nr:hypothetical protein EB74_24430 [Mycobacterium sp. SWH-M5]
MFHPSAAGYALAAKQLLPALCNALGQWDGDDALQTGAADTSSLWSRVGRMSRLWRRSTGVPAPVISAAS